IGHEVSTRKPQRPAPPRAKGSGLESLAGAFVRLVGRSLGRRASADLVHVTRRPIAGRTSVIGPAVVLDVALQVFFTFFALTLVDDRTAHAVPQVEQAVRAGRTGAGVAVTSGRDAVGVDRAHLIFFALVTAPTAVQIRLVTVQLAVTARRANGAVTDPFGAVGGRAAALPERAFGLTATAAVDARLRPVAH